MGTNRKRGRERALKLPDFYAECFRSIPSGVVKDPIERRDARASIGPLTSKKGSGRAQFFGWGVYSSLSFSHSPRARRNLFRVFFIRFAPVNNGDNRCGRRRKSLIGSHCLVAIKRGENYAGALCPLRFVRFFLFPFEGGSRLCDVVPYRARFNICHWKPPLLFFFLSCRGCKINSQFVLKTRFRKISILTV